MMNSWMAGAAGTVVGLGVGWFAGSGAVEGQTVEGRTDGTRSPAQGSGEVARSGEDPGSGRDGRDGTGEKGDKDARRKIPAVADLIRVLQEPTGYAEKVFALREMLAGLPVDALRSIATDTVNSPQSRQHSYQMLNVIGELWAVQDPEGLVAFAQSSVKQKYLKGNLMSAAAREIARTDRNRAVALAASVKDQQQASQIIQVIADVAMEDSPEWAVDFVIENGRSWGSWEVNNLYTKWAQRDLAGARAYLDRLPSGNGKSGAINAVATTWATTDPDAAIAWAESLGAQSAKDKNSALGAIMGSLAIDDPERGLALLGGMEASGSRDSLLGSFASNWFQSDPEAAEVWFQSLDGREKKRVFDQGGWSIANSDPEMALEMVKSLPGNLQGGWMAANAINAMKQSDLGKARSWVESLPDGELKSRSLDAVIDRWVIFEPDKAAEYAAGLSDNASNKNLIGQVAGRWALSDGEAASTWALSLPLDDRKERALAQALGSWAQSSPQEAAEFLENLPQAEVSAELVDSLAQRWAASDPQKALDWARGLPEEQRGAATRGAISSLANTDPEEAAKRFSTFERTLGMAAEGAAPGVVEGQVASVASNIASQWASWQPHEAAAWALGLDDGKPQASAVAAVVGKWVSQDPLEVSGWLVELPEGDTRDQAAQSLVQGIMESDPDSALVWATSVGDLKIRENLVTQLAKKFAQTDYGKALDAVEGAGFPDEVRASILKELE